MRLREGGRDGLSGEAEGGSEGEEGREAFLVREIEREREREREGGGRGRGRERHGGREHGIIELNQETWHYRTKPNA